MPNLVGIGNSQVPTNAMLGGLAYQDSVGEIDIDKIKAKIPTPLQGMDVFVYDTSKDSDGGAWRHRTQNTSWYNEGASETRGARKEFPAVAVIVIENGGTYQPVIKIYDGDDPNLPMWMVFKTRNASGGSDQTTAVNYYAAGPYPIRKVVMLNGIMVDCQYRSSGHVANIVKGVTRYNFIDDSSIMMTDEGEYKREGNLGDLRNTERAYTRISGNEIVHTQCNDIAITVLPNAPIDDTTGLPRPTIAVATDDGTSVIKDDGKVIDLNDTLGSTRPARDVIIRGNDIIHWNVNNGTIQQFFDAFSLNADSTNDVRYNYTVGGGNAGMENISAILRNSGDGPFKLAAINPKSFATAAQSGMSIFVDGTARSVSFGNNSIFDSRVAYVTSNYNTGYMHGDIRGAFLSNTDATDVTGSELVTNGTFASDISGWSGAAQFSHSTNSVGGNTGGKLMVYHTANTNIYISQTITTVAGKYYTISYLACSDEPNRARVWIGGTNYAYIVDNNNAALVEHSHTFYASGTSTEIRLYTNGQSRSYWDSISVRIAELDRSLKSKGLQVFGTINKNPVATGAELVAYSNFSSGRYLFQPYNSDLDFTDTMSIMFWVNGWVGSDSLLHRGPGTTRNSKTSFHLYCSYDYNYRITFTTNGSSEQSFEFNHTANLSGWQCVCFTLSGGTVRGFRNGVEQTMSSTSFSGNIFSQATDQNGLWIGTGPVGGAADTASLALLRLSATAPSPEQIKKMYNDEKCLFHENAKCTFHGSSNDVKALAYDDTTNILHVGTSAGRSEFQGLNRINNTTTAVTTAISASNGLVAEQ